MTLNALAWWLPPDSHTPCYGQADLFEAVDAASHNNAKALCGGCDYREACLKEARKQDYPSGTWGGVLFHPHPKPRTEAAA